MTAPDITTLRLEGAELRAELVARARGLAPLLAGHAARTEAGRHLVEDVVAAIQGAGLFKLMRPRRFGGPGTDLRAQLEVSRELATGCGSTAWVTTIMNLCAWVVGLASEEAQHDLWGADPEARVTGVFAPTATVRRAAGGLVVTGRWSWASGCLHAQWALVGLPNVGAAGEANEQGLALIPMQDLTIADTWFAAGMKGTGSNTLVADEVFVPGHRLLSMSQLIAGDAGRHAAFIPVTSLPLVAPQLGLAAAALALVIERAPHRGVAYTIYTAQTTAPTVQIAVAEAATLIDTAHLHAYRAAADIDEAARAGRALGELERARIRMDTGCVARAAREAIRMLCSAHGAASFADHNPLQRIWRDAEVASRHALVNPEIGAEIYGRALLGVTHGVTPLV